LNVCGGVNPPQTTEETLRYARRTLGRGEVNSSREQSCAETDGDGYGHGHVHGSP